jgi:hypothetical protein
MFIEGRGNATPKRESTVRFFLKRYPRVYRYFLVSLIGVLTVGGRAAKALDYEIVASGPLRSTYSESSTFDGTTKGILAPFLDEARLQGGSFRAVYRFSEVTPQEGGEAWYYPDPSSGMTSYELFDAAGVLVHEGSGPSMSQVYVSNDYSTFDVDQVFMTSIMNSVTGSYVPTPRYNPSGIFYTQAHLSVGGEVSAGVNYLNDLDIPTQASTYLSFPADGRTFEARFDFVDGDYLKKAAPYQEATTSARYEISAVQVRAVPEPAGWAVLTIAVVGLLGRRRSVQARAQTGSIG